MDLKITQPMRMIVSCSKGILGSDDDMSVIKLATNLRSEMSFSNNKTLVTLLKVDYVSVIVNSVDFDSVSVWNDEFQNVDLNWPHNLTTRQEFCDLARALGIPRKDGAK